MSNDAQPAGSALADEPAAQSVAGSVTGAMSQVLVFYDTPLLFEAVAEDGRKLLVALIDDEEENSQRLGFDHVAALPSPAALKAWLQGRYDLRRIFTHPESALYAAQVTDYRAIAFRPVDTIIEDHLPGTGLFATGEV